MTWSILARDPATGELAPPWPPLLAVGAMCIRVEGNVAALSTQAMVNPMYAVQAMPRLRAGETAPAVLAALVGPDPGASQRQFHIIDGDGRIAQHSGPDCVPWAGHVSAPNVSVAGNMLSGPRTVEATLAGYLAARGSMAERLIAALEAGEAAGGDKRGKQSAGLLVCGRDPYPVVDIRADDHPDPLAELRRLYRVNLERFAVFRRFLAGRDSEWGTFDREAIEAAIVRDSLPPG